MAEISKFRSIYKPLLVAVALLLAHSPQAFAGLPDSPLPAFSDGQASVSVMEVTGVVKRGRLQTVFLCSSFDGSPVHIGVELFDFDGTLLNDIGADVGVVLDVQPGQTVTIGTSTTASLLETVTIPLARISQGSGRIVATSEQVACNVLVIDDALTPPVTMATLGSALRPVRGATPANFPLPQFPDGTMATHAAVVPGVIKRGRVETNFFCTSLAAAPVQVGVEVFGPDGAARNDLSTGNGVVAVVAPGETVTVGTTGTTAFLESTVIVIAGVAQGMARIVSTTEQLLCSAMVLDSDGVPPASMASIVIGTGG